MSAPGTAATGRWTHVAQHQGNGVATQAFGRRPVSNSDMLSVSAPGAMRERARSGVLVA